MTTPNHEPFRATTPATDTWKPASSKKYKYKNRCKVYKGPHQPVIKLEPYAESAGWKCGERSWYKRGYKWFCSHREVCSGCGKVLRWAIDKEECPGYTVQAKDKPV